MEDQQVKNTIAHELLHTVEGCCNHQWYWQKLANIVNTRMPKYTVKRTTEAEEKGIPIQRKPPVYRYFFRCTGCGTVVKYQRESKFTNNYRRYYCRRCGGRFEPLPVPPENES